MHRVRHDLVTRFWRGRDPFLDLPPDLRDSDLGSISNGHAFIAQAVESARPGVVVDIGAGSGGSTIAFARELRDRGLNAVVVAVDTFLGSATDWINDNDFALLAAEGGRTSLYPRFVGNVLKAGLGNFVLPLTLDATTAAAVFARTGVQASIVHLDAGDDAVSIESYLAAWWPRLAQGGVLIGGPCGDDHESVQQACARFFAAQGVTVTFRDGQYLAAKPGDAISVEPTPPPAGEAAAEQAREPISAKRRSTLSLQLSGRAASRGASPPSTPSVAPAPEQPRKRAASFRLGPRAVR